MTPAIPGDQIDDYRLDSLIARGGMASVYRATDLRNGATVAIKIPHPEAECDPVSYERFQREEQLGRLMDHPGIVREISEGKKSRVYMALEWVEGRLLREVMSKEGPLPPQRAVRIAVEICEALEHIHSHGVVHRDLKPENIIVDSRDRIKLIDFGIASRRGARRLTFGKFARLTGTADYIAPEQIKGKRGDARTDIYAMGVLLFEMLTGTLPFEGENLLAVMNLRTHQDAPPVREANAAISPELEAIVGRALAREPEDRYRSARDLAWDLEHPDQVQSIEPALPAPRWSARLRVAHTWRTLVSRQALLYAALAMIPMLLFGLMLFVARVA
ncbi:MAG: serine/threonine protein kinase [Acidobacteriia bacterium]|nr:serine/threonine protein kinase [Terriglobia bacterium]